MGEEAVVHSFLLRIASDALSRQYLVLTSTVALALSFLFCTTVYHHERNIQEPADRLNLELTLVSIVYKYRDQVFTATGDTKSNNTNTLLKII
jgi:hypothetical protein